jgi:Flp pilus assembly protein CpaB
MRPRRRRGLLLLLLAVVCGGLAASQVRGRERSVDARVGPLLAVVVAQRDLAPDEPLRPGDLGVRRVPARFVPPDALGGAGRLVGARVAVSVAAGSYVTAGVLQGASAMKEGPLRPGERALDLRVRAGSALALAGPGSRVDVLVSTRTPDGAGRTFVALEDVTLLDLRPAPGSLTAAENFAHEIRLLTRPPGDGRRTGPLAFGEGDL